MLNWNENMENIMQEMKRVKMPTDTAIAYLEILLKKEMEHLQKKTAEILKTAKTSWEMEEKLVELITGRKINDE